MTFTTDYTQLRDGVYEAADNAFQEMPHAFRHNGNEDLHFKIFDVLAQTHQILGKVTDPANEYHDVWQNIQKLDFEMALNILRARPVEITPAQPVSEINKLITILDEAAKIQSASLTNTFENANATITVEDVKAAYTPEHREALIEHMKLREGYELTVYLDSEGKPTVGIGHLVLKEDNLKVGDTITHEQAMAFFDKDIETAFKATFKQMVLLNQTDPDLVNVIVPLSYQAGSGWHQDFKETFQLMQKGKFMEAALEAENSLWNKQTPTRSTDFQLGLIRFDQKITEEAMQMQPEQSVNAALTPQNPIKPSS